MYKCIKNKFKYYQLHLGSKQCIISLPFFGAKIVWPTKKGIYTSNKFTDKNQIKPMIKSSAEVGIM